MDIPQYLTASVLATGAFAVVAAAMVVARAGPRGGRLPRLGETVGVLLGVWFVATVFFAISGAYRREIGGIFPAVAVALIATLAGLAFAVAVVPGLRQVLANPAAQPSLLALQVWRLEGLAFLLLLAHGQLPALFAVPAGVGDLLIGLTAPLMARNLRRRRLAIAWNLFGLTDLALAVFLGAAASPGAAQLFTTTPTTEAMTAFPMAIIPAFLVPLSIGLHVVSLRFLLSAAARTTAALQPTPA
jgi:hypothetical protein